jgi:hypothetical protein
MQNATRISAIYDTSDAPYVPRTDLLMLRKARELQKQEIPPDTKQGYS